MDHKGRTPTGMILNEPEGRIRFTYEEDGLARRLSNRLEIERIKRAARRDARRNRDARAAGTRGATRDR